MLALDETKLLEADQEFNALKTRVFEAANKREAIHVVEKDLWVSLLRLGLLLLQAFIHRLRQGDRGQTLALEDGPRQSRLDYPRTPVLPVHLRGHRHQRLVYGTRETEARSHSGISSSPSACI